MGDIVQRAGSTANSSRLNLQHDLLVLLGTLSWLFSLGHLKHHHGTLLCGETDLVRQQQSLRDDAKQEYPDGQPEFLGNVQNSSKPNRENGQAWRAGQFAQYLPGVSNGSSSVWTRSMTLRVAMMNPI